MPTLSSNRQRLFAPEVIQTSEMDCGPAALKCLLDGHGIPLSYGRLREACQTDVDGTSIDTLEEISQQMGLDAEQVMIPTDHLLLPEATALPVIVVIRHSDGATRGDEHHDDKCCDCQLDPMPVCNNFSVNQAIPSAQESGINGILPSLV